MPQFKTIYVLANGKEFQGPDIAGENLGNAAFQLTKTLILAPNPLGSENFLLLTDGDERMAAIPKEAVLYTRVEQIFDIPIGPGGVPGERVPRP